MVRFNTFTAPWVFILATLLGYQSAFANDYFTADRDGVGEYMRLVESAHVRTVPGWISKGRIDNALGDLKYTLERFPNHPQALQMVGMVAQMTKNTPLAIVYFQKALNLYPQYALTRAQYGIYLVQIGQLDAGVETLKQATEMDAKLVIGHVWLAKAYAKTGNNDLAREAAERAKKLGYQGNFEKDKGRN